VKGCPGRGLGLSSVGLPKGRGIPEVIAGTCGPHSPTKWSIMVHFVFRLTKTDKELTRSVKPSSNRLRLNVDQSDSDRARHHRSTVSKS
jgi:hypothetical protein